MTGNVSGVVYSDTDVDLLVEDIETLCIGGGYYVDKGVLVNVGVDVGQDKLSEVGQDGAVVVVDNMMGMENVNDCSGGDGCGVFEGMEGEHINDGIVKKEKMMTSALSPGVNTQIHRHFDTQ